MRIHERLSPYFEAFLRLIYPAACGVCETSLELEESPLCRTCGSELHKRRFDLQTSCLETSLDFIGEVWALYPYESPVKELLTSIKFSKKRWLVQAFAEDLKAFGTALAAENRYDLVIPVPLDRAHFMERHFNQAALFAGIVAGGMKKPLRTVLKKKYSTPAQSRLNQKEREINLYQAFQVAAPRQVQGKRVLLVDDVLTTGSTVREAARALKAGGASSVDVFAVACTSREL
jgi:ComF family protein